MLCNSLPMNRSTNKGATNDKNVKYQGKKNQNKSKVQWTFLFVRVDNWKGHLRNCRKIANVAVWALRRGLAAFPVVSMRHWRIRVGSGFKKYKAWVVVALGERHTTPPSLHAIVLSSEHKIYCITEMALRAVKAFPLWPFFHVYCSQS